MAMAMRIERKRAEKFGFLKSLDVEDNYIYRVRK